MVLFGILGILTVMALYAAVGNIGAHVAEKDRFDALIGRGEGVVVRLDQTQARRIFPLAEEVVLVGEGGQKSQRRLLACVAGADGQVNPMLGYWDGMQVHSKSLQGTSETIYSNRCLVESKA